MKVLPRDTAFDVAVPLEPLLGAPFSDARMVGESLANPTAGLGEYRKEASAERRNSAIMINRDKVLPVFTHRHS